MDKNKVQNMTNNNDKNRSGSNVGSAIGQRVIEEITRPPKELLERLAQYDTTDLCDGAGIFNAMDYHIKPQIKNEKIVGPAVTVKVPIGASLAAARAIDIAKAGDIIVIDGHGVCNNALWGGHRSFCCQQKGITGVIIDGAFRDIDENEELGFPIYARALTCGAASKNSSGEINVPISCGGVIVNPGDIIVGDRNGVVVIKPEEAEEIMQRAQERINKQRAIREEMLQKGTVEANLYK